MNNRPLKFRAYDKATNRMYPEFYLFGETTCFGLMEQWVMQFSNGKRFLERMEDVEAMQFTGLKDSAGKEIYEGDIVKVSADFSYNEEDFESDSKIASIEFGPLGYSKAPAFRFVSQGEDWDFYGGIPSEIKIVGNIFQNPELLT